MKESVLKRKMALTIRQRGGWARSIPGGPHGAGLPDIMFFYRGQGGGIEAKLPGKENNVTQLQAATLDGIRDAGGWAEVMSSVQEIRELLDQIDDEVGDEYEHHGCP